jgi:hypothetical protein
MGLRDHLYSRNLLHSQTVLRSRQIDRSAIYRLTDRSDAVGISKADFVRDMPGSMRQISTPRKISRISEGIWRLEKIFIDIAHYLAIKLTAGAEKAVYRGVIPRTDNGKYSILLFERAMVEMKLITPLLVTEL